MHDFKPGDVIEYGHSGSYHCEGVFRVMVDDRIRVSMARCIRGPEDARAYSGWLNYDAFGGSTAGLLTPALDYVRLHPRGDEIWAEIVASMLADG